MTKQERREGRKRKRGREKRNGEREDRVGGMKCIGEMFLNLDRHVLKL